MKTLEIIDRLPVGEVVPKRVLAVLKRAKVIDDYAPGGYLDGKAGDFVRDRHCYLSDKVCGTLWNLHYKFPNIPVEKFFDYLHHKEKAFFVPPTRTNRRVNRTMSLWGAIC